MQARTRRRRRARIIAPVRRGLGLRTRLTLTYGLGAALLAAVMSITTFGLTRENLMTQREESSVAQAVANAARIASQLPNGAEPAAVEKVLTGLPTPEGAQPVLHYQGQWYATNTIDFGERAIPDSPEGDGRRRPAGPHARHLPRRPLPRHRRAHPRRSAPSTTRACRSPTSSAPSTAWPSPCSAPPPSPPSPAASSASGPAGGSSPRCSTSARPPRPSPAGASTPASPSAATPTSTSSPSRSTRWPRPSRTASSATPGSPPRSATSCARR